MLDLLIAGGQVLDGTGAPAARADVGVRGDAIVGVGDLAREPAGRIIDARGRVVTPGFIDMHSHSDWRLWANRRAESKIRQGVTTEVVGNCGFSPAPISEEFAAEMPGFALFSGPEMDFRWRSFGEYLARYRDGGTAVNVVHLVGHGAIRLAAMGFARRAPTAREQAAMERLMDDAMAQGAWGLSTGLIYAPGSYAETEEIVGIARCAARAGGLYASHIRGEAGTLLDATREAIRIGREAKIPVQISHVKAAGRPNWGKVRESLELVDAARAEGLDVQGDVYPYTASSTTARTLLPDWVLESGIDAMVERLGQRDVRVRIRAELTGGGRDLLRGLSWSDILIAFAPGRPIVAGRRLSDVAAADGRDGLDALIELVASERGRASVILFQIDEADLRRALVHPHVMVGSDGSALAATGPLSQGSPHPRSYGTFPRVLGRYARDEAVLSLPAAVHKMTGLPARRLGLRARGVLRAGARADLVVLDAAQVGDRATYESPHQYPEGIDAVVVNGQVVVQSGEHTGALPGRVLTRT